MWPSAQRWPNALALLWRGGVELRLLLLSVQRDASAVVGIARTGNTEYFFSDV